MQCLNPVATRMSVAGYQNRRQQSFLWGNPPATGEFPSQRLERAESVPVSWRHDLNQEGEILVLSTQSTLPVYGSECWSNKRIARTHDKMGNFFATILPVLGEGLIKENSTRSLTVPVFRDYRTTLYQVDMAASAKH